ncbi:S8 family serine peptidase [Sandaracinobacteroides hominis]|uniref:S8 family serine peptidase n=1 Tax=Sandaracinobacteroides hominis TaxID=2780086 RepID=UPI0018F4B6E4|nr:S8 family serine peptidase [Sandaracinobacteroides hominis]
MARYFYRRGEKVPVTEVSGVVAVKVRPGAESMALGPAMEATAAAGFSADLPDAEKAALAAAGWAFVRPEGGAEAMAAPAVDMAVEESGKVFQESGGHVLIAGGTLIVQLLPTLTEAAALRRLTRRGLKIVRKLGFAPNQFQVEVLAGEDPLKVANELQESGVAVAAEPEFTEFIGHRLTPTDPTYARQWHLNNVGGAGSVAGADIRAERAWDFTRGRGVRVAVIDNGFDVAHQDLAPAIVAESGFFDGSGNFRQTLTGFPGNDHGTFCAGMVAARHNNGRDGCGSAPECELMLIASRGDQVGTQATLARAVAYATDPRQEVATARADSGADVIVSSLGPNGADWALTTVLENALIFASQRGRRNRGTPVFWASSNGNNVDIARDQVVSHRTVIAVGRSRRTDLEDNSARGAQLDFLAPGVQVVSTAQGGGTRTDTGTSFAAPLSAGVGALVLAVNPDLTAGEVCQILRDTCDKIGGVTYNGIGHHVDYGHGRVNAFRAVMRAMQSIATDGVENSDQDADRRAEIPVSSPWGLGTLKFGGGALTSLAMAPNGSRFNGWLLNTADNRFGPMGDFDGDGRSEIFVRSPWGVGVLQRFRAGYRGLMLAPNGTRFGGWLLNTADNSFGPVGDFDGDRRPEMLIRSPWGIGILKLVPSGAGFTFQPLMMAPNGTRFGGWLLNTADNVFGPVGDFDGDGRDEMLITSPWGIGMLKLVGGTLNAVMMAPNGTRFGGWLLNTADNWLGPAGDIDGDGRDEFVIESPWGLGIQKLSGGTLTPLMMAPNGTRFGGWLLNSFDNRIHAAADLDGDGRAELFLSSPWGVGVLEWNGTGLACPMLAPNGTRFGGWLLNTADNQFRNFQDITGGGRANIFVESPWGVGVWNFTGTTFTVPMMAPNGTRFGGWLLNTADNQF